MGSECEVPYVITSSAFFVLIYENVWTALQSDWFLIIELYHLISKNEKLNFVIFPHYKTE